jgi:uroporphyrinogen decarboxylase
MATISKRERVDAALRGQTVDRVPVAAWRHFIPAERYPSTLAQASLQDFFAFDWDWLKVNPRATYYAEAWGNRYDFDRYHGVLPELIDGPLNSPQDLAKIDMVSGVAGVFAEQLDLVRRIKAGIKGAHFLQTVFSPLSVLAFLAARPAAHTQDAAVQAQFDGVRRLIDENPAGVHAALDAISTTLAEYAAVTVEEGASGLFFAIVKLAREGVLTRAEYEEFGKPYDLRVLAAVKDAPFNLLHICGPAVYFDLATEYPVHAINWAGVNQQNPTVGQARTQTRKALVGGVDELGVLQHGAPEDVLREARAAIEQTGGIGLLLAPGCGVAMDVPAANLHALRRAAEYTPVAG